MQVWFTLQNGNTFKRGTGKQPLLLPLILYFVLSFQLIPKVVFGWSTSKFAACFRTAATVAGRVTTSLPAQQVREKGKKTKKEEFSNVAFFWCSFKSMCADSCASLSICSFIHWCIPPRLHQLKIAGTKRSEVTTEHFLTQFTGQPHAAVGSTRSRVYEGATTLLWNQCLCQKRFSSNWVSKP